MNWDMDMDTEHGHEHGHEHRHGKEHQVRTCTSGMDIGHGRGGHVDAGHRCKQGHEKITGTV